MKFLNSWRDNTGRKQGSCVCLRPEWSRAGGTPERPDEPIQGDGGKHGAHWHRWLGLWKWSRERETERGAFRSPRGAVCLLFLDNSHPSKMLVQISRPAPLRPSPTAVQPHKPPTSGIPEDWHCQQDQMKWDLGGPRAQRVKINRPDVRICECGGGSAGMSAERCSTWRSRRSSKAWGNGSEFGSN